MDRNKFWTRLSREENSSVSICVCSFYSFTLLILLFCPSVLILIKAFCGNNGNADKDCVPKCSLQFLTYIFIIPAYEGASAMFSFMRAHNFRICCKVFWVLFSSWVQHGWCMCWCQAQQWKVLEGEVCSICAVVFNGNFYGCHWACRELKCPQLLGKPCVKTWIVTLG